jgi:hypothetical protein
VATGTPPPACGLGRYAAAEGDLAGMQVGLETERLFHNENKFKWRLQRAREEEKKKGKRNGFGMMSWEERKEQPVVVFSGESVHQKRSERSR